MIDSTVPLFLVLFVLSVTLCVFLVIFAPMRVCWNWGYGIEYSNRDFQIIRKIVLPTWIYGTNSLIELLAYKDHQKVHTTFLPKLAIYQKFRPRYFGQLYNSKAQKRL